MKRKMSVLFTSSVLIFTLLFSTACNEQKTNTNQKTDTKSTTQNSTNVKNEKQKTPSLNDDFYENVNAELLKDKAGDENSSGWDNFTELSSKVDENIKELIQETAKNNTDQSDDSAEKAIATLYNQAKDYEANEKAGLGSLKEYIDSINSADSVESYFKAVAKVQKELGKSSLLPFEAYPDPKDSSRHALLLNEPSIMGKKEDMEQPEMKKDLNTYIEKLLNLSGIDAKDKIELAKKVTDFQIELSKSMYSKADKNNINKTLNYFTPEELQAKLPNMKVSEFLKESGLEGYQTHVVSNPGILDLINQKLTEENLEMLKSYSVAALVDEFASYSNKDLREAKAAYEQREDDEEAQALDNVKNLADMELGELYAKKYFSPEKKSNVEKMVRDVLAAYREKLSKLDWMSEESRAGAIKKIDTMNLKISYPEEYKSFVKGGIIKSTESGGTLIENAIAISKARAAHEQSKVSSPVDKSEWGIAPQEINGYYDHTTNEIVLGAGMLQAPFYDENASYAKNLGGIGAVIAHETTHAFDDNGSHYDENGNLRNWWTDADREKFNQKTKDFIKYFGNYEPIPGHKVDGELTLGENIADLGAVNTITSMLGDDKEALKEMYKSYANLWASKASDDEIKDQLQSDEHSPNKIRVNAMLSSVDKFYEVFNIKPGDKMYVKPEDRVKMY